VEALNNNQISKQFTKLCKKGCGKLIKWDASQNKYFEIETNDRHRCPQWNPKCEHLPDNLTRKITQEQQIYVDTIGPAALETRSAVQNIERLLMQEKREEKTTQNVH
jgi:hypothetical protein